MTAHGTGDDLWDEFVKEYEKGRAPHEASAAERAVPEQRRRRRWPWTVLTVGGVLAGSAAYLVGPWHPWQPWRQAKPVAVAVASAEPTVKARPAPAAVSPDQAFPATVSGYTRVGEVADRSCTGATSVGPTLAGMITQGHGCLGLDFALYKDGSNNEYDLAVFTMKDPTDAASVVTALAADPTNYQVAVQVPPTGSGLRALPADSGLVQAFAGYGHVVVVGMAQWSDGHSSDFQRLESQLSPLLDAVAEQAGSHDRG